jgi:hypothetical protein
MFCFRANMIDKRRMTLKSICQDTMILNSNAAGSTGGVDDEIVHGTELLRRLGSTEHEIENYIKQIEEVREYT